MTTAVLLVLLGALTRLLPHPPNFVALGALALYSGARLPRRLAVAVPLAAMALSDMALDLGTGRRAISLVRLTIYATFAAIVLAGRYAVGRSGPFRLAAFSVAASTLFFITSNFAEWAGDPLYPKTAAGLLLCYLAAIPFFGNTLAADLLGTGVLFGLDALARRRRFLAAAGASLLVVAMAAPATAQSVPPASESVVVTATSVAADEKELGSATTVITREQIERSGRTSVLDLLRTVPGVDVVQSGTPGSLTSVLIRGANSTQTLVLVDGARVNSSFFPGYDFSAVTTENIERIEIVRGPFSALYGSDAIGGVVQIFTRPASEAPSGRVTAEAGNAGQKQASAFVTAGEGPFAAAASFRYAGFGGERPNSDWRERNGSARLEARLDEGSRLALEAAVLDGETGNPGPEGAPNASARGFFREERLALPGTLRLSDANHLDVLLAEVRSKPGYRDTPGGFESQTDARTAQVRVADTQRWGPHVLTAFASYERWTVDDRSNFGVNLDGARTNLWGAGAQEMLTVGPLTVTAGFRFDHHSTFGDAWSPRATFAWVSSDSAWKLRASGGGAFRAPTVGELYYPFSGNPDLKPERSVSWELAAERYVGGGRAEASLFWNDFRDLIVYDFAFGLNRNIGRARTRGVEVGWRQTISGSLSADATYTYLDAKNRETDSPLIRRPRHRAAVGVDWEPAAGVDVAPRLVFVGRRADNDPVTAAPAQDPSSLRFDLFARWRIARGVAPYVRLTNAFDRRYDEADGYPAAGRLVSGGVELKF